MMWLFAETQKEMWLLVSEWLATPGLYIIAITKFKIESDKTHFALNFSLRKTEVKLINSTLFYQTYKLRKI